MLIEDETSISAPLAEAPEAAGFDLTTAATAADGLEAFGADRVSTTTDTTTAGDVKGNCDEAKHANDPRCTGAEAGDD